MKIVVEIPDLLLFKAKLKAKERGQSLEEFIAAAVQANLAQAAGATYAGEPSWMSGFGKLRGLRKETARVPDRIDEAFEMIESRGPE